MKKFVRSFHYAGKGLRFSLGERNMRIHIAAAATVVLLGVFFQITSVEWAILLLCIGVVLAAELINTAIEELADAVLETHSEVYFRLGPPKDLLAGAVLVLAVVSCTIGLLIFLPHFLNLIY